MPDQIPPPGPERDAEVHRLLLASNFLLEWIGALPYSTSDDAAGRLRSALETRFFVDGNRGDHTIAICHPEVRGSRGGVTEPAGRTITGPVHGATYPDALTKAALLALRGGR